MIGRVRNPTPIIEEMIVRIEARTDPVSILLKHRWKKLLLDDNSSSSSSSGDFSKVLSPL